MQGKRYLFLLPLGGILTALCLVFPKIGFLQWLTMMPALLWLFSRVTPEGRPKLRTLYGAGFLYFLSFYLTVYHWFFYLYPMEFAGVTPLQAAGLVAICWLGLSLLQTVFSALIFPLFGWLCGTCVLRRYPVLAPFLFAVQYTVAEWSQTFTWMGVPWARLSLGQLECGFLINSAAFFGSYFITLVLVLVNALLAYGLLYRQKERLCALVAVGAFLLNLTLGGVAYLTTDTESDRPIVVAAAQGNNGSTEKWSVDNNRITQEVYRRCTAEAAARGADVVLLPETFLPYSFGTIRNYVVGLATEYDITVICGAFLYDREQNADYNSIFIVYPDGTVEEDTYSKQRLVPFGEFVPWRPVIELLIPPLADMNMLASDLLPGRGSTVIQTPHGNLGGLICFDSIYEGLTLQSVRNGAELILLPTNDSWFTNSAAVYMHAGQARLRAIEGGRWILRSAETGISCVIDPRGEAHDAKPPLTEGVAISTAYLQGSRTLYSYIGNTLVYLMVVALLALPGIELVHYLKKRKDSKQREVLR